ncbi:MAG: ribonuclease P protein component [Xenococcaceae cyanobacterium]
MGLPQANRLKHRRDFQAVYQHGIRRCSTYLTLRALSESTGSNQTQNGSTRIGISISKKVSKKAVIRNRIKRQIRGVLRELLPYISKGWKIVVVLRPGAASCKYEHFLRELKQLLVKAEIINGH